MKTKKNKQEYRIGLDREIKTVRPSKIWGYNLAYLIVGAIKISLISPLIFSESPNSMILRAFILLAGAWILHGGIHDIVTKQAWLRSAEYRGRAAVHLGRIQIGFAIILLILG